MIYNILLYIDWKILRCNLRSFCQLVAWSESEGGISWKEAGELVREYD
jgi:hypothetical protein